MVDFRPEGEAYDVAILGVRPLLEALLAAVEEGAISADEASQRIFAHLHLAPRGMAANAHAPACRLTPEQELAIAMA